MKIKFNKKLSFILLFLFIVSCSSKEKNSNINANLNKSQIVVNSPNIDVPEPSIAAGFQKKNIRFKLTKLQAVKEKFFKINDYIVFTGLENYKSDESILKTVKLNITSHCIINQNQVIIKKIERVLEPSIPIIELLSDKILLSPKGSNPSCSFQFIAKRDDGLVHHFTLPQLPIVDYQNNRFISLYKLSGTSTTKVSYISMNNISQYGLNIADNRLSVEDRLNVEDNTFNLDEIKLMDTLNLVCDDFSLSGSIRQQQFIPMALFSFDSLTQEKQDNIKKNKPTQRCRIFGYQNQTLVGVSSFVNLFYQQSVLNISLHYKDYTKNPDSFYTQVVDTSSSRSSQKSRFKRKDFILYSYKISNFKPYDVSILIEDFSSNKNRDEMELELYNLYFSNQNGATYDLSTSDFIFGDIQINENGFASKKNVKEGTLIVLKPNTTVKLPVIIPTDLDFCKKRDTVIWLGSIVKYPNLKIYQLTSNRLDTMSLSDNIQHTLDTQNGDSFNIFTDYLAHNKVRTYLRNIYFQSSDRCDGYRKFNKFDPVLQARIKRKRITMKNWIFSPVPQSYYRDTKSTIQEAISIVNTLKFSSRKKKQNLTPQSSQLEYQDNINYNYGFPLRNRNNSYSTQP